MAPCLAWMLHVSKHFSRHRASNHIIFSSMAAEDSEFVPLTDINVDSLPEHEVKHNNLGEICFVFNRKSVWCNMEGCGKHWGVKKKDAKPIMTTYGSDEDAAQGLLHHYRTSTHDLHKEWNKQNDCPGLETVRQWLYDDGVLQVSTQEYSEEETLAWQNEALKKDWDAKIAKKRKAEASSSETQLAPRAKKAARPPEVPPPNSTAVAMPLALSPHSATSALGQPGLRSEMMFVGQGPSNEQKLGMLRQAMRFDCIFAICFAFDYQFML